MHHSRFVFVLALAILASVAVVIAADSMPQVGQQAPGFTLPSQDGTNVSLKDFKGKWVVVYFYPKDKTPGCTIEAHNFQRDLAQYDKKKTVILGVSVDSTDSHKEFCAEQSLTFKLLSDTQKKVVAQYVRPRRCGARRLRPAIRSWSIRRATSPMFGSRSTPTSTARKFSLS